MPPASAWPIRTQPTVQPHSKTSPLTGKPALACLRSIESLGLIGKVSLYRKDPPDLIHSAFGRGAICTRTRRLISLQTLRCFRDFWISQLCRREQSGELLLTFCALFAWHIRFTALRQLLIDPSSKEAFGSSTPWKPFRVQSAPRTVQRRNIEQEKALTRLRNDGTVAS